MVGKACRHIKPLSVSSLSTVAKRICSNFIKPWSDYTIQFQPPTHRKDVVTLEFQFKTIYYSGNSYWENSVIVEDNYWKNSSVKSVGSRYRENLIIKSVGKQLLREFSYKLREMVTGRIQL